MQDTALIPLLILKAMEQEPSIGDAVELQALSQARRAASDHAPAAAIGSVKANIGHTKAAAGVAGLIKTAMALQAKVVPPTTGCDRASFRTQGRASCATHHA